MALTRKLLKSMGIDDEKIDQIIEAHSDTVDALKEDIKQLKEKSETLDAVQKELDEAKKSLERTDDYKTKYDTLKSEYDTYKTSVAKKAEDESKTKLYRDLLKTAGVSDKRLDAVMKVTSLDGLKVAKDGSTLEDADKLTESIKREWADFIGTTETKGAETPTPPAGGQPSPAKSRAAELYSQHYKALYGEQKGSNK